MAQFPITVKPPLVAEVFLLFCGKGHWLSSAPGILRVSTQVGGIVGGNDGNILECTNNGIVSGTVEFTGGIVGTTGSGTLTRCDNYGKVIGIESVGGISGVQGVESKGGSFITKCSNKATA